MPACLPQCVCRIAVEKSGIEGDASDGGEYDPKQFAEMLKDFIGNSVGPLLKRKR